MMNTILLKNVNVFDGRAESEIQLNKDIYIENGIIKEIGEDLSKNGVRSVDLNGAYVMPGLINLHVHLPASGKMSKGKVSEKKKLAKFILSTKLTSEIGIALGAKYAKTELLSGVTTIRAVGGVGNFDRILRDRINAGKKMGPRILAANTAIGVPDGHMDGTVAKAANSIEEAVEMVRQQASDGADLIKLMITGGILDTKEKGKIGLLRMQPDMIKACCDEAHKLGLKVAAHIEGEEGVKAAILNGVDTVEHGAPVSDELIEMLKESGRAFVATFSPAIPLCFYDVEALGYDETVQYNSNVLLDGMKEFANKCLKAGVPVGLGTDTGCPLVTHYDMWRELFYYTKFADNVDNKFALYTATLLNAKLAGVDDVTGSIEEGKSADMIIVKDDPTADLATLKEPIYVISRGKIYTQKNKHFSDVDAVLDKIYNDISGKNVR